MSGSSRAVVVAVVDTGIDTSHPALVSALWTNPGETGRDALGRDKATNGIDDDGNGFVDDVHGWNFVTNSPVLTDQHGHGTHIAGVIAKAPGEPKLMILKYYDPKATDRENLARSIASVRYANKMGAQIINYSGGGYGSDEREREAFVESQKKGIIVVAAAGNEHLNSDLNRFYPAGYGLSNFVAVAATDREGKMLATSNYGAHTVDIAAPGGRILSTLPDGKWGYMTGTSQATAVVTLILAQIMNKRGPASESATQTKMELMKLGSFDAKLEGKTKYQVRLNVSDESLYQ